MGRMFQFQGKLRLRYSLKMGDVAPQYCDCIILFYTVNPQIHGKREIRALGKVTTCHIGNYLVTAKLYIICRYTRRTRIEPM